jgi:lipoprotein-anchoring transpeptidase ErfK/SrfK
VAASGDATPAAPAAVAEPTPSPAATPALTLVARTATLTAGEPTTLVVRLGVPGATVQLSRKTAADTEFLLIGPLATDARGVARFRALPRRTTTYRVDYAGDGAQWLAAFAEAVVSVHPRVSFSAPERVYRDRRARLAVTVRPAHPGAVVTIERRQDGAWTEWRSLTLRSDSRAQTSWRTDAVGAWPLRVVTPADADHLEGRSLVRRVQVVKPNPYNVPLDAKGIVVVDISQYRLRFYSYGRLLRSFPCVTGRPGLPTPIGHFSIYARGMWPGGPYGARIMSYHPPCAIHGTNEPELLKRFPRNFSHGCTRLLNANAIWLYDHAPLGTPVWNVP